MITDALGPRGMTLNNRRVVVGPRGGRVAMPVTCLTCVSLRSCNPAPCTEMWGCESWVDIDGHRVALDIIEAEPEVIQGELW